MPPVVWILSTMKDLFVHRISGVCEDIHFKLALPCSRQKMIMHIQCTYKLLRWSVSSSTVPLCIRVSLLEERSLKTDKFKTVIRCRFFQVDFITNESACHGSRSRMCVTSAHEVFALQNLAPDLFTLLKLCTFGKVLCSLLLAEREIVYLSNNAKSYAQMT